MVSYLFISIILAVLGLAAVAVVMAVALPRARHRRRAELASESDLEDFLRRVDQATTDEDIPRLGEERGDR